MLVAEGVGVGFWLLSGTLVSAIVGAVVGVIVGGFARFITGSIYSFGVRKTNAILSV